MRRVSSLTEETVQHLRSPLGTVVSHLGFVEILRLLASSDGEPTPISALTTEIAKRFIRMTERASPCGAPLDKSGPFWREGDKTYRRDKDKANVQRNADGPVHEEALTPRLSGVLARFKINIPGIDILVEHQSWDIGSNRLDTLYSIDTGDELQATAFIKFGYDESNRDPQMLGYAHNQFIAMSTQTLQANPCIVGVHIHLHWQTGLVRGIRVVGYCPVHNVVERNWKVGEVELARWESGDMEEALRLALHVVHSSCENRGWPCIPVAAVSAQQRVAKFGADAYKAYRASTTVLFIIFVFEFPFNKFLFLILIYNFK